jgi:hypothetical protein
VGQFGSSCEFALEQTGGLDNKLCRLQKHWYNRMQFDRPQLLDRHERRKLGLWVKMCVLAPDTRKFYALFRKADWTGFERNIMPPGDGTWSIIPSDAHLTHVRGGANDDQQSMLVLNVFEVNGSKDRGSPIRGVERAPANRTIE